LFKLLCVLLIVSPSSLVMAAPLAKKALGKSSHSAAHVPAKKLAEQTAPVQVNVGPDAKKDLSAVSGLVIKSVDVSGTA